MAGFTRKEPRLSGNLGADTVKTIILVDDGKYTATASAEFSFVGKVEAVEAEVCIATFDAGAAVIFCIEGYNPATGNWDTLANTGTIGTAVPCPLLVSPHAPNVVNASYAHALRERMRVTVHHADTKCVEYSIIASAH